MPIDLPVQRRVGGHEDNGLWKSGFKVSGWLQPEEFLDWMTAVEEVLDFKEVSNERRLPLVAT